MTIKTNLEHWKYLENKGLIYSHLKDGSPESFVDKIIGYSYPITMVVFLIAIFYFYLKLPGEKCLKTFIVAVSVPTTIGWVWGSWLLHADPVHPVWLFPPWAVTNIEFIMSIEDWLWYPVCTALLYIIYKNLNFNDFSANRELIINFIIAGYLAFILFFLLYTAACGVSVTFLLTIPGLLLFIYMRDALNIKNFIYFTVILVSINIVWDWTAASWVHSIDGMAWASQWVYIGFSETGEPAHSNVFLDYEKFPWAWIFNNPIEITPALGFGGAILNYPFFAAVEKFFRLQYSDNQKIIS